MKLAKQGSQELVGGFLALLFGVVSPTNRSNKCTSIRSTLNRQITFFWTLKEIAWTRGYDAGSDTVSGKPGNGRGEG